MSDTKHIIDKITKARQRLLDVVAELSEEEMARAPDGEWSIREILHHIGIGEDANVKLAQRTLAGDPVAIDDFELDRWNVEQVSQYTDRPASEALQRMRSVRERTLDTLQSLPDDDLSTTLDHPGWGEMTIGQLFRALGTHDLMHRRDILKRLD